MLRLVVALLVLLLIAVLAWKYWPQPEPDYSTHHTPDGRFHNPRPLAKHDDPWAFVKWRVQRVAPTPIEFPSQTVDVPFLKTNRTESTLTWIGHSTFLLQHAGVNVLTDPVFSKRVSPVQWAGPARTTPVAMTLEELPAIDAVIISHDHYDHLDLPTVQWFAKQKQPPLFIVPLGIGQWLKEQGYPRWVELDWWQSTQFNGWTFNCVPVQHFSGRHLLKMRKNLWAGWVLQAPDNQNRAISKVFFGGDTGYFDGFKDIYKKFGEMDVSMIPVGAYNPRWFMKDMHVNPAEAVQIHQDIQSKYSVGMHWGTFILTDEPMDEPPVALKKALDAKQIPHNEFEVYQHGQTVRLNQLPMFKNAMISEDMNKGEVKVIE